MAEDGNNKEGLFVPVEVNSYATVNFQLDTGAAINLIPRNIFNKICSTSATSPELNETKVVLKSYNGSCIRTYGMTTLVC